MRTGRRDAARAMRGGVLRGLRADDGIAMLSAIIMVLILASLSLVVLALVAAQVKPTEFARKNTRTIFAAEAGVEAALGQIRSVASAPDFTGAVYGDLTKLPCTLTGTVSDAAGALTYSVTVRYYKDNPAGKTETWLEANKMACRPATQPAYAYLKSQGFSETTPRLSVNEADRTLSSVYQFNTTNTNVAGGRIYTFYSGFCLRADTVSAGSKITYVAKASCGTDDDRELWLYDSDYKIKLAVTTLPGATQLCITGAPSAGASSVEATLQNCKTDSSRWNQLWSWEGGSRWRGENSAISDYSSYCLYSGATGGTALSGNKLSVANQCAGDSEWGSFNPDPAVGPGAASIDTKQIVNYLEFGRCFDVTDVDVNKEFMIAYPCKQDPSGGSLLDWNHKWYYTEPTTGSVAAPQQIYVLRNNSTSNKYCLQSPGAGGQYVTLTSACSTAQNQKWTRYQDTGNSTSYTFVDYLGRCIGIGDKYNSAWSKLVVTSCSGEADQKWNAPPEKVEASIGNYLEGARS
ncbi:RICIN domain-containing protein [Cellulosimicrobium cellulans]|uniref:RICIN domain-containing protein n=1 Tax=Cellulosimicrobium cellulans TaxID=1710 RepID=UPI00130E448B|nr:ricin-type beta-trefoil lectin domain protein [Cellulosimicrobium cellulans]